MTRRLLHRCAWFAAAAALLAVACARQSWADEPAALYIFPAGGQRGATVDFRVGGLCLHETCQLHLGGAGLTASPALKLGKTRWFEGPIVLASDAQQAENYPKDYAGQVVIAADAPLGPRSWQVSNSQGVTPALRFMVGEYPEVVEEEIDGEPLPIEVRLPVTINGRIFPREDVDLWSFQAKQGQTIHCEVHAARLGSPLDSQLEIIGPAGQVVAANGDFFGADSFVQFSAPADGVYQARISDVGFAGLQNYVYRLSIAATPRVTAVYPLGGKRGAKSRFELQSVGLADESVELALPDKVDGDFAARFQLAKGPSNPVLLDVDELAEQLEQEPNDTPAKAQAVSLPANLNGRIQTPGDVDLWSVTAKKGEILDFDLRAGRFGSPLDSLLVITDEAGKELGRNDDIAGDQSDSRLRFTAPADGVYYAAVSDRLRSRGGKNFSYRLRVERGAAPDFRLSMASDALTLYRGAEIKLKVEVERLGGFAGPIELSVDNLPSGVTLAGAKIAENAAQTELSFKADATAPIKLAPLTVRASAKVAETTIERVAIRKTPRGESTVDKLLLAVSMPTPFKVKGTFEIRYAPRGSVQKRRYKLERGGYAGPLEVRLADRQMRHLQGVTGQTITVPAGADEFEYPITLPPWMELGRTSRSVVMASAWVDDGAGMKHEVSFTSQNQNEQIVLLVSPGLLSIRGEQLLVTAAPGQTAPVALEVLRDAKLSCPVKLELVAPGHIRGVSAEPVTLDAGQSKAELRVRFDNESGPFNMPLTVRATATDADGPIVAETSLEVISSRDK